MQVYLVFKSGPEWNTLLGAFHKKEDAQKVADKLTAERDAQGNKASIIDQLSHWGVHAEEVQ